VSSIAPLFLHVFLTSLLGELDVRQSVHAVAILDVEDDVQLVSNVVMYNVYSCPSPATSLTHLLQR
jgi:hypothetical protein